MKKILIFLCFTIIQCCQRVPVSAQIADFVMDSCYSASTISLHWITIDSSQLDRRCAAEYGFEVGQNELIVFGLRFANTGQHDGSFPYVVDLNGNRLPDSLLEAMGLHWDSCHTHLHIKDWGVVKILDRCKNVIGVGGKVGLNMYDGLNFMDYLLTPQGACTDAWLRRYSIPDYSLSVHPPNDEYNGTTRLGLSAGFFDTYTNGTWGNNIRSNAIVNDCYYLRFICNASLYFNQGFNFFPDSFDIPMVLSGPWPPDPLNPRTAAVGELPATAPADPFQVTADATSRATAVDISWQTSDAPCRFVVTPILVQGQTERPLPYFRQFTQDHHFLYPKDILRNIGSVFPDLIRQGTYKFRFSVRAESGNLQSADVKSLGQPVNVK